ARDGPLVPFFLVLTDPAAADTYTLSLHAALPISIPAPDPHCVRPIGQRIGRELSRARLERPAVHSTLELDVELVRAEGQARGVGVEELHSADDLDLGPRVILDTPNPRHILVDVGGTAIEIDRARRGLRLEAVAGTSGVDLDRQVDLLFPRRELQARRRHPHPLAHASREIRRGAEGSEPI